MEAAPNGLRFWRVRGYVLRYDAFLKNEDGNPKVQREQVVEDVQAIDKDEAIEKVRKICAVKWNLVTESSVKYYNKEGVETPGYVFTVE